MTFCFGDHIIGCPDGRKTVGYHILEHFLDQTAFYGSVQEILAGQGQRIYFFFVFCLLVVNVHTSIE